MADSRLDWGLLGTGGIAKTFAHGLAQSRTGRLVAVASRTQETADLFAEKVTSPRAYVGYEKLLDDPEVEAVYICTPHPFHAEWCLRAARAGKHILCEKPLTMNLAEAEAVAAAAREHGVFLMEAFMYRCHPQTARLLELIHEGAIGKVGVIHSNFSFYAPFQAHTRHFNKALGGGGILDVGCYTTSISRLIAGAALGQAFANPTQLQGHAVLHPETGIDLYAIATAEFPGGILAQLSTGVGLNQGTDLHVYGSEGSLFLPTPFIISPKGEMSTIVLTRNGSEPETMRVDSDRSLYALEADAVSEARARGARECPAVPVADTLGNMAALDAWRASVGLTYESEKTGRGPGNS